MKEFIKKIRSNISNVGSASLGRDGTYRTALKAAYVKSFEYLEYTSRNFKSVNTYFHLGSLRGICEDYIVLSYFGQLKRKDKDIVIDSLS